MNPSSFLTKARIYFYLTSLLLAGCQKVDFPVYDNPISIGNDYSVLTEALYTKIDTVYSDTSITKNKIHLVLEAINKTTPLGRFATIVGTNTSITGLKTDSFLLSIKGTPIDSVYISIDKLSTVTSTTISGYKVDKVIVLYPLVTTLPSSITKINSSHIDLITIPSSNITAVEVAFKQNGTNLINYNNITAAPTLNEVPQDFIRLLTQGNKELSSTTSNDKIKGWQITGIYNISSKGGSNEITKGVTVPILEASAGLLTYYPDGYYTFISATDESKNQYGWFRVALENGIPIAILFKPELLGSNFQTVAPIVGTNQIFGYGIWGISNNNFYPLIRFDRFRQGVFVCNPYEY